MEHLKERYVTRFSPSERIFLGDMFGGPFKSKGNLVKSIVSLFTSTASDQTARRKCIAYYLDSLVGSDQSFCKFLYHEIKHKKILPEDLSQFELENLTKQDLQRAFKSIDGIQFCEGLTKEMFFSKMEEAKIKTRERKEIQWHRIPHQLSEFYECHQPYSFEELNSLQGEMHRSLGISIPHKLPPVLIWIVEDAIFGWNRACFRESKTVNNAIKRLDELAVEFADKHFFYKQLEFFPVRSFDEYEKYRESLLQPNGKLNFNDDFYADWKAAREARKLSTFSASQMSKPGSFEARAKRYLKICDTFSSFDISNDSSLSSRDREILSCIIQDLDRKTNGYLMQIRNFFESSPPSSLNLNVFITRRNLILTASMLILLGLNKFIDVRSIFHVHHAKEMNSFMEKRIYRIFGPHRRIAVLITKEHEPPLNKHANLKIVDVHSLKDLSAFLNILPTKD